MKVKVVIAEGQPDYITLDGKPVTRATFEFKRCNGYDRVVIHALDGPVETTTSFPIARGTFEGDTHPREKPADAAAL